MNQKSLCGQAAVAYLIMTAIREGETVESFHPRCDEHLTPRYRRRAIRIADVKCSAVLPSTRDRDASIRRFHADGQAVREIAGMFGITTARVYQILKEASK